MNVKRYVGKSTRDALRLLREELGPDALILANRPCEQGVEILAAAATDQRRCVRRKWPTVAPLAMPWAGPTSHR